MTHFPVQDLEEIFKQQGFFLPKLLSNTFVFKLY